VDEFRPNRVIYLFRPSLAAAEPDKILIFLLRRKNRAGRDADFLLQSSAIARTNKLNQ